MGNKDASILVMIMDVLIEKVRKESMVLADDVVLCRGNPIYMTEYIESLREARDESVDQQRSECM